MGLDLKSLDHLVVARSQKELIGVKEFQGVDAHQKLIDDH